MEGEVLNISPVVVWAVALSNLLTFGLTIWNLMASGGRANAKKLDEHSQRMDRHAERLHGIEISQRTMPTKDDMHSLSLTLQGMRGEIMAMRAKMEGNMAIMERLEVIVSRHENHLLKS